jgi:hypothetical protein
MNIQRSEQGGSKLAVRSDNNTITFFQQGKLEIFQ